VILHLLIGDDYYYYQYTYMYFLVLYPCQSLLPAK
jgi:hypothetical protein